MGCRGPILSLGTTREEEIIGNTKNAREKKTEGKTKQQPHMKTLEWKPSKTSNLLTTLNGSN